MTNVRPAQLHERFDRPVLGTAYYAEYLPPDRLETDLDLIAASGLKVIRIGESVWSTWEPTEGSYNLDWLEPVLDGAHERDLSAIVGTPTYAVPPWLHRAYPDTAGQRRTGIDIAYGGRQDVDITAPDFLRLAEAVTVRIVDRYREHPAIIGWQLDNEPGNELLHNARVFESFKESLREQFGSVDAINERWGLTFWSHRLADWDDLWVPDGNTTPSYDLAWRRHQARIVNDFISWQYDIVRPRVPEQHFITTCMALGRPAVDPAQLAATHDTATSNVYYLGQDWLDRSPEPQAPSEHSGSLDWIPWRGVPALSWQCDLSRGSKQAPFLITETNATTIGYSADNFPAYDGQWRQAIWLFIARGARLVGYWHWHTLHFGFESFWGGILGHHLEPGRCHDELAATAGELEALGAAVENLTTTSDIAILHSPESKWAHECQPSIPGGEFGSYQTIVKAVYEGVFDTGLAVDIIDASQFDDPESIADRSPVLVVPALFVASNELCGRLLAYVEAGGHLVLTPRSLVADEEAVIRSDPMPGPLRAAAGVSITEFSNLETSIPLRMVPGGPAISGRAAHWVDGLRVEGAEIALAYDHPHFGRFPAVVTQTQGEGRITTVGFVPDARAAADLMRWIASVSLPEEPWRTSTRPLTVHSATDAAGNILRIIHNWSWEETLFVCPEPCLDLSTNTALQQGDELTLGPWDVRAVQQSTSTPIDQDTKQGEHP